MAHSKIVIILFFSFTNLFSLNGQNFIEGTVRDDKGLIPFANIKVKDTKIGTVTNVNGYFKLEVSLDEFILEVTAVGYHKFKKKILISEEKIFYIDIILADTSYDIEQVVVTGTLKESFVKVSPVKVEVISSAFLKKTPTNNFMEIIEIINGVQKQVNCGVCGTSDIHINGMEGPYSLILIDGMPIMSSLSSVYGLNGIPTSFIKQIEIIKGPSSTLYGSEAVAGVINIITKSPENISKIEVESFMSSDREKNINFSWSPKWKKTEMLLSLNLFHMNNFIDKNKDGFSDEILSKRISLFNKWLFYRSSGKKINLSTKYYFENRFGGVESWTPKDRGSDSIYGESIITKRWEISSHYEFPSNENIILQSSYNYHHQDSYYGDLIYNGIQQTLFNQILWYKNVGLRHQITTGIANKFQNYDDNITTTQTANIFNIPGIFIQDEFTLSNKWELLSGIRWDKHKNHGSIFAPRLNLKWSPNENSSFRWNTGTGFRVVNIFTEEHAALSGARDIVISNELKPEESINLNFNFHHEFQKNEQNTNLYLDLFYTYFTNKIVPDYDTDQTKILYDNIEGYAISKGVSFQINKSFYLPLNISLGGTFLDVFSITNEEKIMELFAPSVSGTFSLGYEWPLKRLKLDYTGIINGPMYLPKYEGELTREEKSPWYSIQHLKIQKTFNNKLMAFIGIRNIFNYTQISPLVDPGAGSDLESNETWQAGFSPNFDTAYVYGPTRGRRFIIGIQWHW